MKTVAKKGAFSIPTEVTHVTTTLEKAGFEAYLVGGCVRDLYLEKTPKDWDVTTNATPDKIQGLFPNTFYENDYGTVGVVNDGTKDESLKVIEVTPYRLEAGYSDKRRPDSVIFSHNLEDDLKRRDFTINAIALSPTHNKTVDLYGGTADLEKKIIRAVGNPSERISEDALRILRAIRLQTELGFVIESDTLKAIETSKDLLKNISAERIRDEFVRIIMSPRPMEGLIMAQKLGILRNILPELEEGIGMEQTQAHKFDVWEHSLRALQHARQEFSPSRTPSRPLS
ncbi:CCA tRNA nucleotidyltransferase [Candidatus Parcubacteria bacterium]|nr:CCA tRNA nucleotidyltransferase [Candidatus Parcubacteria bacterium]